MAAYSRLALLASGLVIVFGLSGGASAEESKGLAGISPYGKDACFGRIYDYAHLQRHPGQKVSRIFFFYGKDPVSHPNEEPPLSESSYNGFLTTTVRNASKPEWVGGWCGAGGDDGTIHCGMECDRTMATLKVDAKGSVVVNDISRDLYLDAGSEEELGTAEFNRQALGNDDDGFRLDPMPVATCKAELARIDPIDPALGAPLRERLKPDQPFCYGRDYDAKHLASHPDQVTATIRVFRGPVELASYAATNTPDNWPNGADITISVTTTRNGKKVTQGYNCDGEADQWRCVASEKVSDFSCDLAAKEIYLRRGVNGTMMLANPNSSLPIVDLCSKAADGETVSDDKVYRLDPMPQSACAP